MRMVSVIGAMAAGFSATTASRQSANPDGARPLAGVYCQKDVLWDALLGMETKEHASHGYKTVQNAIADNLPG